MALGFAVALAAAPGAIVVPASAEPDAAVATAGVGQAPGEIDPADDPTDLPFPVDEEDEDDEESDAEADTLAPALPFKPSTVEPDSVRFGKGTSLPTSGGAPAETLGYKPPGVGAAAQPPVAMKKERRTPFGIHPAAFFVVLLVGHVFIVRAVTD